MQRALTFIYYSDAPISNLNPPIGSYGYALIPALQLQFSFIWKLCNTLTLLVAGLLLSSRLRLFQVGLDHVVCVSLSRHHGRTQR